MWKYLLKTLPREMIIQGVGQQKRFFSGTRKEKRAQKGTRVKLDDYPFYAYSVAESMKLMKLMSHIVL